MVLPKYYGCIRCSLICFNVLWAVAITCIAVVLFVIGFPHDGHGWYVGHYILIAIAIITPIVAFLGCLGALQASRCMLITFFSCLLVIIVAQFTAGAWLYCNWSSFQEVAKTSMIDTIKNKYSINDSSTEIIDAIQGGIKCCGATGPSDWIGSQYSSKDPSTPVSLTVSEDINNLYKLPESCCKEEGSEACNAALYIKVGDKINPAIWPEGCIVEIMKWLSDLQILFKALEATIACLELLALIFSLVLYCAINSSDKYKA
ncbi:CD82 antigen [Nomia melanderi]|uniref:CD82 antigen n=1 Tax=Nomia melanderi TaxID=2448451 RepID=UPI0013046393|nr:CD82 antigen [Nomia melanderi]